MRLKTFQEREYCGEREKSFLEQLPVPSKQCRVVVIKQQEKVGAFP
jgi:hypothetical protein